MNKKEMKHNLLDEVGELSRQKLGMKEYLFLKISQEDWHGVADAAMDIREIIAKIQTIEMVIDSLQ